MLLFFLLLTVGLKGLARSDGDLVKVNDVMPAFSVFSDDGKEFKSTVLKGKVIVICFFATWCPPCQKELAAIEEQLWPAYKENKDFSLLVIGREHSEEELKEYNERKGFTFPLYPDKNRAIYSKFATSLIPRIYLIGKDGKVKHTSTGFTENDFRVLMQQIGFALQK
ncbi:MAG: TlpA family protein disulfide reductase [Tannerellaceae bacterium]|nr:TlpA family protein disulfide reductase [Tannerellaceae bacterium]